MQVERRASSLGGCGDSGYPAEQYNANQMIPARLSLEKVSIVRLRMRMKNRQKRSVNSRYIIVK